MHLKVWKRVKTGDRSDPFCGAADLTRTQSREVESSKNDSKNDMNDSPPAFLDAAGRPLISSEQSQAVSAGGQCALQGETSVSLQTQPLVWQTTPTVETEPRCSQTQPAYSEATHTQTETGATGPLSMTPPVFSARPGTAARFRLVEKVHHGELSIVWRAFDEVRQTSVAVKFMPQNLAPAFDAQTLARLVRVSEHPGMVTLIEHGWQDQWWYQIAEWVDGKTLASLCRSYPISMGRATSLQTWMKQLAEALEAQHCAGFVHGDVKPSNVLVTSGKACLIDLVGLRIGASWTRHLTPAFASPEAREGAPADPRDDVYSLAAMICKLLIGQLVTPERASNWLAPPAGVTAFQWQVLRGALHPNRERRVESPIQLVDAMWPASTLPQRKPLPTPRRAKALAVPALIARPRQSHRRRIREYARGVGGKAAVTAALTALVIVSIGTEPAGWGNRAVSSAANEPIAVASEPIAEQTSALSGYERVDTQLNALAPVARASIDVIEAPASRSVLATPLISTAVAESTATVERPRAAPAALTRTELAATAAPPQGRALADRPDASAFADRAEVPVLSDRRQVPRTKASRAAAGALGMPAVAYRLAPATMPVRTESATADQLERPDKPDGSGKPERPDLFVKPDRLERPEKPERLERVERPEKPERPDKLERPEKPERPDKVDRPEKPERPDKVDRPEKPERPDKVDRPEKPERPDKVDRPEKPERPDKVERPEKPERPDKVERPEKPDRPEKPEKPERPS